MGLQNILKKMLHLQDNIQVNDESLTCLDI